MKQTNQEIKISIPALKKPTLKKIQKEYSWIKSIERDDSTEEQVTLRLATVLEEGEKDIDGEEYEKRFTALKGQKLGYQHAIFLWDHQKDFPELMKLLGEVYIDFPGICVVDVVGRRRVPYLCGLGGRWYLGFRWIGDGFDRDGRLASKSLGNSDSESLDTGILDRLTALESDMEKLKGVIRI